MDGTRGKRKWYRAREREQDMVAAKIVGKREIKEAAETVQREGAWESGCDSKTEPIHFYTATFTNKSIVTSKLVHSN